MAEAKNTEENTNTGEINRSDCIAFARKLYRFTISYPKIRRFLPRSLPEENYTFFTENIGKAVLFCWHFNKTKFREYDYFHLKFLVGQRKKANLIHMIKLIPNDDENIFSSIIHMTAFLMEVHLFMYERLHKGTFYLKQLPALWTDIFETLYIRIFFSKGGWSEFKLYARDHSPKFDAALVGINIQYELELYDYEKRDWIRFDLTKEFRLFIVQKSLQILNTAKEKVLSFKMTLSTAVDEVKVLFILVSQIVELCEEHDVGKGNIVLLNWQLRKLILTIYLRFSYGEGFIQMLRSDPSDGQGNPDPRDVYEKPEEPTEPPLLILEDCEDFDLRWMVETQPVMRHLSFVMPPGTDESNISMMLDEDYIRNLLKKIGGLQLKENTLSNVVMTEVMDEINKAGIFIPGVPDQMGEKESAKVRIKTLKTKSKSTEQTLLKVDPSSVQPATHPWAATGIARPKSSSWFSSKSSTPEAAAKGGESSKSTVSSAGDFFLEEMMKDLRIWGENREQCETES